MLEIKQEKVIDRQKIADSIHAILDQGTALLQETPEIVKKLLHI